MSAMSEVPNAKKTFINVWSAYRMLLVKWYASVLFVVALDMKFFAKIGTTAIVSGSGLSHNSNFTAYVFESLINFPSRTALPFGSPLVVACNFASSSFLHRDSSCSRGLRRSQFNLNPFESNLRSVCIPSECR